MQPSLTLSAPTIENFIRDGAVVLRGALSRDEVQTLEQGIEHNLAHLSPLAQVASNPDDPGRFVEDFCTWQSNPQYEQVMRHSALPALAAQLMQSQTVRIYHDHLLVKEPGTRQSTPWHQDQPYYNVDGVQNVSFWIPADPVSRAATLEFAAGTHRGPWLMPRTFMTHEARWFPEGTLAELPDIEATRGRADAPHPVIGWALEPGDAVAFHMLTLHASGGVEPGRRRRVFSVRFLGDDMRHAPRRWKTSPDFPDLADELPAGAPMEHPLFPLLWSDGDA